MQNKFLLLLMQLKPILSSWLTKDGIKHPVYLNKANTGSFYAWTSQITLPNNGRQGRHHDGHWNLSSLFFACSASNIMIECLYLFHGLLSVFGVSCRNVSRYYLRFLYFFILLWTLYDCKIDIYSRSVSTCRDTKRKTGLDL